MMHTKERKKATHASFTYDALFKLDWVPVAYYYNESLACREEDWLC